MGYPGEGSSFPQRMNFRQFIKVKRLRRSLDRVVGVSSGSKDQHGHDVPPDGPQPHPPVLRTPVSTWDRVVNISLAALLASIVALISTVSYSNPQNIRKTTEVVTSVVLKILLTAAVLGWTTSSFSKRARRWP